jgi:hypothetical protein
MPVAGPRNCGWCGRRTKGGACKAHADLETLLVEHHDGLSDELLHVLRETVKNATSEQQKAR